jgi:hypothetical protein
MEKEITLSNGLVVTVKEVKYNDFAKKISEDKDNTAKILFLMATDISEEDYNQLSIKDGYKLQKIINEINGLDENFL